MTERLYYDDPYLREFTATVLERVEIAGRAGVVLDRTAFYPTSGGQPHDTGVLGGARVIDVVERGDLIVHVLAGDGPTEVNIHGEVDWPRRFDHMQQHSGQHVLSGSFQRLLGAETVSFHLGDEVTTIELAVESLGPESIHAVELAANRIIFENLPIQSYFVDESQVANIPLRRQPVKTGRLRVVEVKGFDYSACGGTHCRHTGEIGLVKVTRWERRGKGYRVEFVCGQRALADYGAKSAIVAELGALLSTSSSQIVDGVRRLVAQNESRQRELELATDRLAGYEAEEMARCAIERSGVRIVRAVLSGRSLDEVRRLAAKIVAGERRVALLAVVGEKAHLVFARSADVAVNVNEVMKATCQAMGGRGGGTPQQAQGGGIDLARVEEALELAQRSLELGS